MRQAGSAVRPDKLRFDFTHGQALSPEELRAVEDRVNEWIKASRPVRWLEMERAEAERLGAMALFGEKYGEWVRVVEVDGVSRELCGGTHVANTAEVGIFKIASEGSSAANVRRIEALTGPAAIDWFREREEQLREAGELLGAPQDPLAGARRAAERLREAGEGAQQAEKQLLGDEAKRLVGEATEVERPRRWSAAAGAAGRPEAAARPRQPGPVEARRRVGGRPRRRRGRQGRPRRPRSPRAPSARGLSAAAIVREAARGRRRRRRRPRRHGPGGRQGRRQARRGAGDGARGRSSGSSG